MNKTALHVARIALGLTFLGIAYMIYKSPAAWGGFIKPWASHLLLMPAEQAMMGVAVFDAVIGLLLLANVLTWVVTLLAALHLASVVIVIGFNASSVRDIGLFGSALALWVSTPMPVFFKRFMGRRQSKLPLNQ